MLTPDRPTPAEGFSPFARFALRRGASVVVHYDRFGGTPRSVAPIDYILVDVDPPQRMDLKPVAHLFANPTDPQCLSDHAPLLAVVR